MPNIPTHNTLAASSAQIINGIRAQLPASAQEQIPVVQGRDDLEQVGKTLSGNPGLMSDFAGALMLQVALRVIKSAVFYNRFRQLKKGTIEYGNTVEEIFVDIIKAVEYDAAKGPERELARTLPSVNAVFHPINWRVMYPLTIDDADLARAFRTEEGLRDLIERLIASLHTSAEIDDMLLVKYLLIKAITAGELAPVAVDPGDTKALAKAVRSTAAKMSYPSSAYNRDGRFTSSNPDDLVIIIDAEGQAELDVEVLASAFNMDKANVLDHVIVIDSFSEFDNSRFDRVEADYLEEVTDEELALLTGVRAVVLDTGWFQLYDNELQLRETQVGSGLYRNYWLHTWKIVSSSPYHNAVVFADSVPELPATLEVTVSSKDEASGVAVFTLDYVEPTAFNGGTYAFQQTEEAGEAGVRIFRDGGVILPNGVDSSTPLSLIVGGQTYTAPALARTAAVGDTLTFTQGDTPGEA